MTPDNSPSLGGQSNDLSPMISSVQTRVIADARGAYLAGNLHALIHLMTSDQQQQFQQSMLKHTLSTIRLVFESRPRYHRELEWVSGLAYLVENPNTLDFEAIRDEINMEVQGRGSHSLTTLLNFIAALRPDPVQAIVQRCRIALIYLGVCHIDQAKDRVDKWQVEAAWAILRNAPIPPLELTP
jgi:hypothetical protein